MKNFARSACTRRRSLKASKKFMSKAKKNAAEKSWRVPSDLSEVQKASARVISFFKPLGLSDAYRFDIRLCLEEALINAMKYGNGLKREVPVELKAGFNDKKIWLELEDRGKGFDVRKVGDCTRGENLLKGGGRGIYLIHQLMDEVRYNARGNSIWMTKSIQGPM